MRGRDPPVIRNARFGPFSWGDIYYRSLLLVANGHY